MRAPEHIDVALARLAAGQGGQVCRRQLLAAGLTSRAIGVHLQSGHLLPMPGTQGVYAVGHMPAALLDRWWTPVLLAHPDAGFAGAAAAFLYGLLEHPPERVDVSVPRPSAPKDRRPGWRFHRRPGVPIIHHEGRPVVRAAQVLLDLAQWRRPHVVRRAVERAQQLELDVRGLDELLATGGAGTAVLRRFTGRPLDRTRSLAEAHLLIACEDRGLPTPRANVLVGGDEVDFLWAARRLVLELDVHPYHRTRSGRAQDAAKTGRLAQHGLRVLRSERLDDGVLEAVEAALRPVPFTTWRPPKSVLSG